MEDGALGAGRWALGEEKREERIVAWSTLLGA